MTPLYAYSLLPVLAVAVLLFFTTVLRVDRARGLTAYCSSVAFWCAALLLSSFPETGDLGRRLAASGAFIAASFLHAAYDVTEQRNYSLVWLAYAVAAALTLAGILQPGVLYDPLTLRRGPMFWPAMALAVGAAVLPLWQLARAYPNAAGDRRIMLRRLFLAGLLCDIGGMSNAILLAHGTPLPFGMLLVFASLLALSGVVRDHQPALERKLMERSLLYSAIASFLSAGYLLGVLTLMTDQPLVREYRLGAFFLLSMAALAFEPLRQQIQEAIGRRVLKNSAAATQLAAQLKVQEEKAERAERLAELGTFASAVAHEVRNPLGVLAAHLKILSRAGTAPETVEAMREQIDRASRFVDDMLRYGRPRPLELRMVDAGALLELALSTAAQGLGDSAPPLSTVEIERAVPSPAPLLEADQAQLTQVLVILIENALLALGERTQPPKLRLETRENESGVSIAVEDNGPGVPKEIMPRLFEPFVTSRKREGKRAGTGLGLATARRIVERHNGRITAGQSNALHGARFELILPKHQTLIDPNPARALAEEES